MIRRVVVIPDPSPLVAREIHARQLKSVRVTVGPRTCECRWCTSGPRRLGAMLVNYRGRGK